MKAKVLFLLAAVGVLTTVLLAPPPGFTGSSTREVRDPVEIAELLNHGDEKMNLADQCLQQLFREEGNGETARLLRILNVTDFELSRITIREIHEEPKRVRFGFEFRKPLDLKTVYWEQDCPVKETER